MLQVCVVKLIEPVYTVAKLVLLRNVELVKLDWGALPIFISNVAEVASDAGLDRKYESPIMVPPVISLISSSGYIVWQRR